jgi:hypothetical protein
LEKRDDSVTAYIYFDYQDRLTQSATNVLFSLLKQLLQSLRWNHWPTALFSKFPTKATDFNALDERDLMKSILHCARQFPKVYFVFDALDECEDIHSRSKIIDFMYTVTQMEPRVRILVTSRPHLPFMCQSSILVQSNRADIEAYIRANISHKRYSSDLQDEIVSKILAKSDGLYLPNFQ